MFWLNYDYPDIVNTQILERHLQHLKLIFMLGLEPRTLESGILY